LDTYATFQVFLHSVLDLSQRQGVAAITGGDDPTVLEELWQRRRSLMKHLTRTAEQFWVAEKDGKITGYARSIIATTDSRALALYHWLLSLRLTKLCSASSAR
jgi:hypothetical protein